MTTPQPPDSAHDAGPGEALRRALDALPAERTPPDAAWRQLESAITATRLPTAGQDIPQHTGARRRNASMPVAAAAAMLVVVLASLVWRQRPPAQTVATVALLPVEQSDPRVRAVLDETRNWRTAASDSLRSVRWPSEARDAIESALASTDAALASARTTLRADPGNVAARDAITSLRSTQLALLQRAMALLDEI